MSVAKHFIVGFEGTELSAELAEKLQVLQPAGFIFYDTNIETKEQVKKLISDLKNLLGEDLIISVDQEGGKVERLRKICPSMPSLAALGKADDELIIAFSKLLASELLDLGFNLVFAPCADLATNPGNPIIGTRSLGADAQKVSRQIKLIIETYQAMGLNACAKHFPGHGDTSVDSHLDLPLQKFSQEEYSMHLEPFKAAIDSGVSSIMVAHLMVDLIDAKLPASISPRLIKEELREKLDYQGLVISDEITMKALSQFGSYRELAQKMLEAGCDLVIWQTNLDDAIEAARSITLPAYKIQLPDLTGLTASEELPEIELSKTFSIKKSIDSPWKADLVLVYDHPKLELELVRSVFGIDTLVFDGKLTVDLSAYEKILILGFQASLIKEQQKFIDRVKQEKKVLQISCDIEDAEADIHIYGPNKIHLEALKGLLYNPS